MRHRFTIILSGLVVFALVAIGCGGGSSKQSAGQFADSTCAALSDWVSAVADASADLNALKGTDSSDSSDLANKLNKASAALGTVDSATGKFIASINSKGAPDVQSGDQLKKQLVDGLTAFRDGVKKQRTIIDNFDTESGDSDALSSSLSSAGDKASSALDKIDVFSDNSDLSKASEKSKVCKSAESSFSDRASSFSDFSS